MSVPEKVI
ncbi:UNVERIFIED_CONTAM: hypothetical protein GTU68_031989 [Idotea baltica]|nr:hypothetical protein [Idotea baltica]